MMTTKTTYSVLDVVALSVAVTEMYGFVAKKDSDHNNPSTASKVQKHLIEFTPEQLENARNAYQTEALELIEWGKENLRGDFGRTVKDMLNKGAVTLAQVAFLVALPNQKKLADEREQVKEEQSKLTATSEWFGSLRKRDKFFVKLTQKKFVDNYGSYIYSVVTREGNIGSFFSQNNFDVTEGDCFLMKATPKRHIVSSWHGGKETQFNRVVIEEVMGKKEEV